MATSTNPEAPNPLMDALQRASVVEEHRTLMGMVVERIQSSKSVAERSLHQPINRL